MSKATSIPLERRLSEFCNNLQFARGIWQRHRAWVEADEFPAELKLCYDASEADVMVNPVNGEEALEEAGIVSPTVEVAEPSVGAEYFRELQLERLKRCIGFLVDDGSLAEILFLAEALELWDSDQHLYSHRRDCYLADFMYRYLTPGSQQRRRLHERTND